MKNLILLLTLCLSLLWAEDIHATHLMGADLTYTIVGPHQYTVTLSVYRDCNSSVVQPTSYRIYYQSVSCNDTGSFVVSVASGYPVNATDTCASQHSTCNGGTVYGIQQWLYTSAVINLPANCPDIVMSWASGNRNAVISNLNNPTNDALYISAEVNTSLIDNSPKFLNPLTVNLCLGQVNYVNQGGYDSNGDSLVYVLDTAQGTNGGFGGGGGGAYPYIPTNLTYVGGYTPTHPITSSQFNFDPTTGQITVLPTQTEYDVVKLIVYEYRNHVLIGHVERDMQIEVNLCTDTLPVVSGIGAVNSTDTVFTISPCTSACFTVYGHSADTSKTLTLSYTGQASFPGATFTVSPGRQPSLTFCWSPTRANAGIYNFTVTVKDNNCPSPGHNTQNYKVIVPQIYPAGSDQTICQYNNVNAIGNSTSSGLWSAMASNPLTTIISNPSSPTTLISGFNSPGRYNYIWTSNTTCIDTMSIFVTSKPNAGPDVSTCQYGMATMAATGTGVWTPLPTNPGTATITNSSLATTTINSFSAIGTYSFIWSSSGCIDTANVTVTARPNAGPDQTICTTGIITMSASGTGTWTAAAANPVTTVITNPTSPSTTISGLSTSGIYTYYWGGACLDTVIINAGTRSIGGPNQTICQYSTIRMGAIGTGTWTSLSGNPTATSIVSPTSDSTVVTGFSAAGTYYFIWSSGTSCPDTVLINVTGKPNAGTDQTICQYSSAVMTATGTGTWTAANTNPAVVNFGSTISPSSTVSGFTSAGTYTLYWSQNGCSDTVLINVTSKPNAGTDQTICQYTTTSLSATGTGTWTAANTNPAVINFSSTTSPTSSVSGFTTAGIYALYWSQNGCNDTVLINVTAKPNAGADQTICQYSSTVMTATGTGTWTAANSNPAVVNFGSTISSSAIVSGFTTAGTYTLYWSQNGCSDTVLINVTAKPNAGTDQTICQYTTTSLSATGTGTWTAANTNPAVINFSSTTSPTSSVSGFTTAGTYALYWSQNGCNDTVLINVTGKPNAGADQTICQYSSAVMTATGTGTWTAANTNPAAVNFSSTTSPTSTVSGFTTAGTYAFYWSQNGCSDTVLINVTAKPNAGTDQTICQYTTTSLSATGTGTWTAANTNPSVINFSSNTSPTLSVSGFTTAGTYAFYWSQNGCSDTVLINVTAKPNAGTDQTICQYTTTSLSATGTGTWTAANTNPAVINFNSTTSPTSSVSGFTTAGTYTLYWSQNGCSDTVLINVTAKPNAGTDQTICQYTTTSLSATGTGTWTAANTNPSVINFSSTTSPTSSVSGFTTAGTYTLYWSQNGCNDTVLINVTGKPNAGADQTICQYSSAVMTATGTGTWTAANTNPAVINFSSTTSPTSSVSGFTTAGIYALFWSRNGCIDTVLINVTGKPNAGADQSLCAPGTILTTATGSGFWISSINNPSVTNFGNTSNPNTYISGFTAGGTYLYIWTLNGCSDSFSVLVTPINSAGSDQVICQNNTVTTTSVGIGNWSILTNNPTLTNIANSFSDTTSLSGFIIPGLYGYVWSSNICTDTFYVNVTAKPNAGTDQTICQYTTTSLSATGTGTWTAANTNPAVINFSSTTSPTSSVSGFTTAGTYAFYWSQNGCSDTVLINVTAKPNAGTDQTICQYTTTSLSATGTGTWTAANTNPAVINFGSTISPSSTVSGFTSAGTYTLYWSQNGCNDTVLINVTGKPNAGADQTICQYTTTSLSATGTGTWTAANTNPAVINFSSTTSPTSSVSGFTTAGTYALYWSQNGCNDTVLINVTGKPNAGADQTICQYSSTVMTATGTGTWTAANTNPSVINFSSNTSPTLSVSGFTTAGTYAFYWSQNGCSDTVLINVTAKPNAGTDQTICQYTTTSLSATGTGTWTAANTNPAVINFSSTTSPTSSVSGFTTAGTYALYWSQNGCNDTVLINVTGKHNAGADQTICQYSSAVMTATGTGTWTAANTNPAAVNFSSTTSPTSTVSGFTTAGTYAFYWSQNGCSDTVLINVTAKPNAGTDQTICQYTTTSLSATGTGTWTAANTNPSVINFSSTTSPTSSVSGFTTAGTYALYWSQNGCSDTVLINVTAKPNAGTDQTICQYTTTSLSATGTGTWTAANTNPAVINFNSTTSPTSSVSGFTTAGTYTLYWSQNGCSDTVLINVTAKPNAGTDQTICQYTTTSLSATGTGTWTAANTNPSVINFSSTTSPTSSVSGFTTAGTYALFWSQNGCYDTVLINVTAKPNAGGNVGICILGSAVISATSGPGLWTALSSNPASSNIVTPDSSTSAITGITVTGYYAYEWTANGCTDTTLVIAYPISPAGPDQTICQYDTIVTSAFGLGTWIPMSGNPTSTTIDDSSADSTIFRGFSAAGLYGYIWSVNPCTDTLYITVIAKPNAGTDQTICQYTTTSLSATGTGTWTAANTNPAVINFSSTTSPTSSVSGFTTAGTYAFYWSQNGCSDTVLINVTAKPNAGTDQTICQYSSTVMTATGTGIWTAANTNPAVINFNSTTSPTSSLSGFTTAGIYALYWSQNGCNDTILINVTAKPNAGTDQTICQYTTTSLSATGTGTWTAANTNPAVINFSSTTSPTSSVSGFTTAGIYALYWSQNGCNDTVLINVTAKPNAGADQTICQYSSTVMTATGTGTWTAANTNPAVINFGSTISPSSTVSGFTTAGTYTLYWSQNGCSDTVLINVTSKPNAGTDQTICQYTTTSLSATGTGIWTAANTNPAVINFSSTTSPSSTVSGFTTAGTYTFYWSQNGCSDTVLINVTAKPNAGADQTICQYSSAVMTATGTGTWTAANTNPAVINFGSTISPSSTVSGFTTAGIYTLYWSQNGCSDTVLINVTSKPNAGTDQTICQYTTTSLSATGTGIWTAANTNPAVINFSSTTSPSSTVSGFTTAGTYAFYWSQNGCSDTVLINVTAKPNAGADQTICQYSSAVMTATGTGIWTAEITNPAVVNFGSTIFPTSSVSGFTTAGTYTLYWSQNGCSDTVLINVTAKPNAGTDQTICQYTTTSLSATGTGTWTAANTNPAVINFSSTTSPTSSVSGFTTAGTYALYWSQNGCSDTVLINVTAKPNAGTDQTICQYTTTSLSATGTGTWTAANTNPSVINFGSTISPSSTVSGFTSAGTYTLYWSQNGCSDTVLINVTSKPNAGTDQTICQYTTTSLSATGTGTWTAANTNPAVINFSSTTSPTSSVSGFTTAGTYALYWSQNGCSDTVLINVTAKPNAGADQTICQYSSAVMTATGTGTWTAANTNPAVVNFGSTISSSAIVSGFTTAGTYTLYWSQNGCSDTVLINVTAKPNAGTDQTICQYTTTSLSATGTGTWTAANTNPAVINFNSNTSPTSSVSGFTTAGTYALYWSQNGCSDTVLINVTAKTNAGTDQTICQYTTTSLSATGTGTWTAANTNPAVINFSSTTSPTSSVSGFTTAGTYTLYWSQNGCSDTVLINVTAKPNAGPDQAICQNTAATMAATGTGLWTALVTNPGLITIANVSLPNTTMTGFTLPGTYIFLWTYAGCSDTVNINVSQASSISIINARAVCAGQSDTLTAITSVPGGAFSWSPGLANTSSIIVSPATTSTFTVTYSIPVCGVYIDSTMVIVYPVLRLTTQNDSICVGNSATLTALPSTSGGNYLWTPGGYTTPSIIVSPTASSIYSVSYSLRGCLDAIASDTVNVTVPPTLQVNNGTVCLGDSTTLTATPSELGGSYIWSVGGETAPSITVKPTITSTYTVSYAIPLSVCPASTASATVTVTPQPILSVNDSTICAGRNVTLTAIPSISGGTYLWSTNANVTQSITVSPSITTTYIVAYTIAGCGTAIDSGVVTVLPLPTLTINKDTICQGQTATLTALPSRTGGVYTWAPISGNTSSISVAPTATTTYHLSYLLTGCDAVFGSAEVSVDTPYSISSGSDSICQFQSASLSALSSISGGTYLWTPGGNTTSSISVSPDSTTVYNVTYTIQQSVCPLYHASDTVFVTRLPSVTIPNVTLCEGLSTVLTATPSQTGGHYIWTPGGNTNQSITVSPNATTDYSVAYSLNSCPAVTGTSVITITFPPVLSVGVKNANCGVNDGALWAIANGGQTPYEYLWSDALHTYADTLIGLYQNSIYTVSVTDQSHCVVTATGTVGLTTVPLVITLDTVANISCHGYNNGLIEIHVANCPTCKYEWNNHSTTSTVSALSAGTYMVTVSDAFGCSDTASYTITDPLAATLRILPIDTTILEGTSVTFNSLFGVYSASDITSYSWSPSAGLSCADCPQPTFSSSAGTYHYTLVISYNQSCQVSDTVSIIVESQHILYIPNSFTPNGDGVNDIFYIFPRGAKFINLNIFDRWGELIFETQDEGRGWDGRYKGEMMPPGVYVFETDVTFNDGYTVHNKGSITLIR